MRCPSLLFLSLRRLLPKGRIVIRVKSPTRVDLAGGTLDMWPLFNFVGGAKTINMAIDIWTEVTLEPSVQWIIESLDYQMRWEFTDFAVFFDALDPKLVLFQKTLLPFYQNFPQAFKRPFHLRTRSESPIGGGLGGSSSLMISLLQVMAKYCGYNFNSSHEIVSWAHNIECGILNTPTGTQDYYPAYSPGLNILTYSFRGIEQKVLKLQDTPFEKNFLLVNTGRSHHSGLNNFEVLKAAVGQDPVVLEALKEIKRIAIEFEGVIEERSWSKIPDLFQREYQSRLQLTPAFSSPEIERLAELSIKNGADAVKICGAGGGGCVLIWVDPSKRDAVIRACEKERFQCLPARPVS
jgi:D-glycero-alpha-D-manno-heptose-7-phosphate kinase